MNPGLNNELRSLANKIITIIMLFFLGHIIIHLFLENNSVPKFQIISTWDMEDKGSCIDEEFRKIKKKKHSTIHQKESMYSN